MLKLEQGIALGIGCHTICVNNAKKKKAAAHNSSLTGVDTNPVVS
jgi:hypothetical protein